MKALNIFIITQAIIVVNREMVNLHIFCFLYKKILLSFYNLPIDFLKIICYNTSELKRRTVQWKSKVQTEKGIAHRSIDKGKNTAVLRIT